MATFISHSPAQTEELGATLGRALHTGVVLALSGELGAGKTQLVKGIARGLDIPARVHSPTFNLVNSYTGGRLTLFHLDLYRLETRDQIVAAGLEAFLSPKGVTVIEWAERWFGKDDRQTTSEAFEPAFQALRRIQIEVLSEQERLITYEDPGA